MRIALIATADRASADANESPTIAGKSVARHQLDFALALGCGKILCLGHGAAPEAIALRHAAEAGGAQFQVIRGVRDLPAAVRGDDELLVLAQGLLPESERGFALLNDGYGVLVLPAEAGWSAGFERLDLTAAWGGAMVMPGRLAARLDELPDDAEPIATLLRISRQAGVPERALPESDLAGGHWQIVRTSEAAQALEPAWLGRRLPPASPFRPTTWLAAAAMRRFATALVGERRGIAALAGAAVLAMVGGIAAGWFGYPGVGFFALALAALAAASMNALQWLGRSIFTEQTSRSRVILALHAMWDVALVAVGFLAIDGSRAERLFPPLVLAALLRLRPQWPQAGWRALGGDRGLLALLLTLGTAFGLSEAAFMLLGLALLGLRFEPAAQT